MDRQRNLIEQDAIVLDERNKWFKKNRPNEQEEDGYVTTPGHSDDEGRPSASRHAKKTGRWFDSITQTFKVDPDKK